MDEARDDPLARTVRAQQHTGNHDKPPGESADRYGGTRAGAENVEPVAPRDSLPAGPLLIVTPDDAHELGRDPEAYTRTLAATLEPYGVTVRFEPGRAGHGNLIGVDDAKLEVDIRQAVAMVNTEPGSAP